MHIQGDATDARILFDLVNAELARATHDDNMNTTQRGTEYRQRLSLLLITLHSELKAGAR